MTAGHGPSCGGGGSTQSADKVIPEDGRVRRCPGTPGRWPAAAWTHSPPGEAREVVPQVADVETDPLGVATSPSPWTKAPATDPALPVSSRSPLAGDGRASCCDYLGRSCRAAPRSSRSTIRRPRRGSRRGFRARDRRLEWRSMTRTPDGQRGTTSWPPRFGRPWAGGSSTSTTSGLPRSPACRPSPSSTSTSPWRIRTTRAHTYLLSKPRGSSCASVSLGGSATASCGPPDRPAISTSSVRQPGAGQASDLQGLVARERRRAGALRAEQARSRRGSERRW